MPLIGVWKHWDIHSLAPSAESVTSKWWLGCKDRVFMGTLRPLLCEGVPDRGISAPFSPWSSPLLWHDTAVRPSAWDRPFTLRFPASRSIRHFFWCSNDEWTKALLFCPYNDICFGLTLLSHTPLRPYRSGRFKSDSVSSLIRNHGPRPHFLIS